MNLVPVVDIANHHKTGRRSQADQEQSPLLGVQTEEEARANARYNDGRSHCQAANQGEFDGFDLSTTRGQVRTVRPWLELTAAKLGKSVFASQQKIRLSNPQVIKVKRNQIGTIVTPKSASK